MNKQSPPPKKLVDTAILAAINAGRAILDIYRSKQPLKVESKSDESPLTLADRNAHQKIAHFLSDTNIPILSEEGKAIPFSTRKNWTQYWLVDPLDGTKEFIKKNDEFTVNIAFMNNNSPEWGVVFVPVTGDLYIGGKYLPSRKLAAQQIETTTDIAGACSQPLAGPQKIREKDTIRVMGSRSHASPELHAFVDRLKQIYCNVELISAGSSLKFCRVAEGSAHLYPRLGPTMEWDTAAAHAVSEGAGLSVLDFLLRKPLLYNKKSLKNPDFIVTPDFIRIERA